MRISKHDEKLIKQLESLSNEVSDIQSEMEDIASDIKNRKAKAYGISLVEGCSGTFQEFLEDTTAEEIEEWLGENLGTN